MFSWQMPLRALIISKEPLRSQLGAAHKAFKGKRVFKVIIQQNNYKKLYDVAKSLHEDLGAKEIILSADNTNPIFLDSEEKETDMVLSLAAFWRYCFEHEVKIVYAFGCMETAKYFYNDQDDTISGNDFEYCTYNLQLMNMYKDHPEEKEKV